MNYEENNFMEYCLDFYGNGGLYDDGFKKSEIKTAINILKISTKLEFDTVDRERIRDIVKEIRNIKKENIKMNNKVKKLIVKMMEDTVEQWNINAMNQYDEETPHQVELLIDNVKNFGKRTDVGIHSLKPNQRDLEDNLDSAFKDLFPKIIVYI